MSIPGTPYTRLDLMVSRYVDDYELRDAEDESGNCGDYTPTEHERMLILDAINGLICEEGFVETMFQARQLTHEARKADGQHPCCGAGLEHPHYWQCVNSPAAQGGGE